MRLVAQRRPRSREVCSLLATSGAPRHSEGGYKIGIDTLYGPVKQYLGRYYGKGEDSCRREIRQRRDQLATWDGRWEGEAGARPAPGNLLASRPPRP